MKDKGKNKSDGRRGRTYKQLVHDFKETRGNWKLKEEVPGYTYWRTRFGRGYVDL
jgi:hypothetical protein